MPVNAGNEYFIAEKKYLEARTKEEKIKAIEEMITTLPKHKGSEHQLSELRHRLAKLKKEVAKSKKASSKPRFSIRKEGAAMICIIGMTQSGKSTLLNNLTNANVKVDNHPFTTELPQVGMMLVDDVPIQLVEIPSMFDADTMSLLHNCDGIIILIDKRESLHKQKTDLLKILKKNKVLDKNYVFVMNDYTERGLEKLKKGIWKRLKLIKVYTREPGKPKALPPIVLKPGSTVEDVARQVHKDMLEKFQFARIFNDTRASGQKVGLDYILKNEDIIEIHAR
ncbi:MAG TPA: GTPase [archaeon]|nr:GTPase [archaeon]